MSDRRRGTGAGIKLGINWDAEIRLGQVPDSRLAREYGCRDDSVRAARRKRSIPAYTKWRRGGRESRQRVNCTPQYVDWDAQPLGVESDSSIARRLGVSHNAVGRARRRRGIARAPPTT